MQKCSHEGACGVKPSVGAVRRAQALPGAPPAFDNLGQRQPGLQDVLSAPATGGSSSMQKCLHEGEFGTSGGRRRGPSRLRPSSSSPAGQTCSALPRDLRMYVPRPRQTRRCSRMRPAPSGPLSPTRPDETPPHKRDSTSKMQPVLRRHPRSPCLQSAPAPLRFCCSSPLQCWRPPRPARWGEGDATCEGAGPTRSTLLCLGRRRLVAFWTSSRPSTT